MDSNNFANLSTRQQIQNPLLQTILIVVVIAVFGWFVLGPKYSKTQQTQGQLAELEDQRSSLEADQLELNKLINELEDSKDEVKLLDEAVPLTARPTKIALVLETFAQNTGMTVSQLSVGSPEKFIASGDKDQLKDQFGGNREITAIEVSIMAKGSIDQFRNFLTLLEGSGRIIDISALTVTSTQDGPNYSLRLKTYAYELAEKTTPALEGVQ